MSERRAFLDVGVGERRGVIALDGRPERLIIERDGDPPAQRLGAHVVARVRKVDRALGLVFLDLGAGPDAAAPLADGLQGIGEGRFFAVEIRSEGRAGKGASARLIGPAEGPVRVMASAPALPEQLAEFAPRWPVETGAAARALADEAESEALQTVFPLPGGGSIAVERTRALIAVDVDVGERGGASPKKVARATNLAALASAARVLRLKGEGGLVVIDFAGRGHDGPALIAAARAAFAGDNPGVALGPISRFGVLELTVPRRRTPIADRLLSPEGRLSAQTLALRLIRALEREALAEPGAMIQAAAAPSVAAAARPYLKALKDRLGGRLEIGEQPSFGEETFEIAAR